MENYFDACPGVQDPGGGQASKVQRAQRADAGHGHHKARDAKCPRGLFVTELPHHGHSQRLRTAGFFQNRAGQFTFCYLCRTVYSMYAPFMGLTAC